MKHPLPISYDTYYHIYNRGINGCDLFREISDYENFLQLFSTHIDPVAKTFAWVLMKNHFHFLVHILASDEIDFIKPKEEKKNIVYPVKKKYNPVHHGFCESMIEYPWSSYLTTISFKPTKLQRDKVIGWFNSKSEFVEFHRKTHDDKMIESIITD